LYITLLVFLISASSSASFRFSTLFKVVDSRLESPLKRQFMSDSITSQHYAARNALATTAPSSTLTKKGLDEIDEIDEGAVDAVVRGRKVSAGRELDSTDGKEGRKVLKLS